MKFTAIYVIVAIFFAICGFNMACNAAHHINGAWLLPVVFSAGFALLALVNQVLENDAKQFSAEMAKRYAKA